MPILLDDLDRPTSASTTKSKADPKFFSSKLTGSGKKVGLLSESLLPINMATNTAYANITDIEVKRTSMQNGVSTTAIPLAPLTRRALNSLSPITLPVPHADDRFTFAFPANQQPDWTIAFDLTPQSLALYEDDTQGSKRRDVVIQYRMELVLLPNQATEPERARVVQAGMRASAREALVTLDWDSSPIENAPKFITRSLQAIGFPAPTNLDELDEWMRTEYSVYTRIAHLAEIWATDAIADVIGQLLSDITLTSSAIELNTLAMQLRYLENYAGVSLDAYRQIHEVMAQVLPADVASALSKQNMSLLTNHTLAELGAKKDRLVRPSAPTGTPNLLSHLSKQQLAAVTTHTPLGMVQAGAGTGKSSVILQRIKYLEACGVPASDITVLSFTNAAADNITAKNPDVGSMTIARMIIDIYALNHPTHQVAAVETVLNSLEIFFPNDQIANTLRERLGAATARNPHPSATTSLNAFIENNHDAVLARLDTIGQTTLELQIILCYQRIEEMQEPEHVLSKFLIIDEVQDNSVFEFIYLLKYVSKHEQSMFIVGDASQTLYEFRSANPRALNTLEGSGVFDTFRLTTNYRSNQEILDFANVVLGDLETNQFAHIQLQANSLNMPTAASFKEKVTLEYRNVPKMTAVTSDELPALMQNLVIPDYVQGCLDKGEQVAFLAYSRNDVKAMEVALQRYFPDKNVANLVGDRVNSTDIFSKYVKLFWNDVLQAAPKDAAFVVTQGIQNNLHKLTRNGTKDFVVKAIMGHVRAWWIASAPAVQSWVTLELQGSISRKEFFDRLRGSMLDYEIERNKEKLTLTKSRNNEHKKKSLESKPDFVVSTIHGAKGLEFDHVVVLYKEPYDGKMSQEGHRLYYVAFTRAMKTEFVLGLGTQKNPAIVGNHEAIIGALTKRDEQLAQAKLDAAAAALLSGPDEDTSDQSDDQGVSTDDRAVQAA